MKFFELALASKEFSYKTTQTHFNNIHSAYKKLCKYVHTASKENMSSIGSLAHFPSFNHEISKNCSVQNYNLIRCYINILSSLHYTTFTRFHHNNKSVIMSFIDPDIKDIINGATSLNT